MDKTWDRKSFEVGPRRTDKSRTLKKKREKKIFAPTLIRIIKGAAILF